MRRLLGLLLACGPTHALFGFHLPWGDRNRDRNYRPRPPAYLRKRNATVVQPMAALPQYTAAEEQTVLPQLRKALSAVSKELQSLVAYYNGDAGVLERAKRSKRPNNDLLLRERLAEALVGNTPFVIGTIGGDTNSWSKEAWPHVLQKRLAAVSEQFEVRTSAAWWRDGRSIEDAFCLDQLLGDDVDVVIREWSPLWGRSGAFAEGLDALPSKQSKLIWNANVTGRKHLIRSARLVSPRELASHEIQMRQVWNMRQRPALMYVTHDMDGGDDASTLRTALEKGGIFGDAYHKFSSSFLSAFGSTFEKERLWKRKRKKHTEHRRLLNKRTEAKKKARLQRQKVVDAVPEEEGPRSSDGVHSFPRDMPDFETSPQSFRGFWKETRPLYEHGYSALGHELVGHQVAYRLLTYANESLTHFINSETPRSDVERLLRHRERRRTALAMRSHASLPPPVLCSGAPCADTLCREGDCRHYPRPVCAVSSLPKAASSLDVGDFVSNATQRTRWANQGTTPEDPCAGDESGRACYDFRRVKSHKQQQRGFVGEQGSGDLQLDLQFRKHSNCVAVISEAPIVTKTANQANWHTELQVKVEGEVCKAPACSITTIPGAGSRLVVDLKKVDKLEDRDACWVLNPIHVDLRVVPAKIPAHACGALSRPMKGACKDCAPARGACKESGNWAAYDLGCTAGVDGSCVMANVDDRAATLSVGTVVLF